MKQMGDRLGLEAGATRAMFELLHPLPSASSVGIRCQTTTPQGDGNLAADVERMKQMGDRLGLEAGATRAMFELLHPLPSASSVGIRCKTTTPQGDGNLAADVERMKPMGDRLGLEAGATRAMFELLHPLPSASSVGIRCQTTTP